MIESQVTIVITQRERFSYTEPSLESLYEHTKLSFKLIYIDGNSPSHIKQYLELQAQEKGFKLLRKEQFLSPNQARNLGLRQVDTKYVVFIDNDVLFTPHWLDNLLQCAEETGAWLAIPLYLEGIPEDEVIHMAGGLAHFQDKQGKKIFFEKLRFCQRQLSSVSAKLKREQTQVVEFHCVLARTEVFEKLGFLDEQLMSTSEHLDLCLSVCEAGGAIYFEPNSVVAYVPPPPLESSDLPYFLVRWSDEWNQISLNHFCKKWNLSKDDPFITGHYKWLNRHRQLASKLSLYKIFGVGHESWINRNILSPLESKINSL